MCAMQLELQTCLLLWFHCNLSAPLDDSCSSRQLCGGNQAATERMIQFGRELQVLSEQLCRQYGKNATHKKMLQVGAMKGKRRGGCYGDIVQS